MTKQKASGIRKGGFESVCGYIALKNFTIERRIVTSKSGQDFALASSDHIPSEEGLFSLHSPQSVYQSSLWVEPVNSWLYRKSFSVASRTTSISPALRHWPWDNKVYQRTTDRFEFKDSRIPIYFNCCRTNDLKSH